MTSLVILSGGQDSTTCLWIAKQHHKEVHAISFDYGQKHKIELNAARKVSEILGAKSFEIIDIRGCLVSTSPLTDPNSELERFKDAEQMAEVIGNRVEKTFVPMRNTLFLTIAANRAVAKDARFIYTGVCEADNANYPDCTKKFIYRLEDAINTSLGLPDTSSKNHISILIPLIQMSKRDSVLYAYEHLELWKALAYTHTSYDGMYPPTDKNHANVLRAQGFEEADLPDPLVIRAFSEGLMKLPPTNNYRWELAKQEAERLGFRI